LNKDINKQINKRVNVVKWVLEEIKRKEPELSIIQKEMQKYQMSLTVNPRKKQFYLRKIKALNYPAHQKILRELKEIDFVHAERDLIRYIVDNIYTKQTFDIGEQKIRSNFVDLYRSNSAIIIKHHRKITKLIEHFEFAVDKMNLKFNELEKDFTIEEKMSNVKNHLEMILKKFNEEFNYQQSFDDSKIKEILADVILEIETEQKVKSKLKEMDIVLKELNLVEPESRESLYAELKKDIKYFHKEIDHELVNIFALIKHYKESKWLKKRKKKRILRKINEVIEAISRLKCNFKRLEHQVRYFQHLFSVLRQTIDNTFFFDEPEFLRDYQRINQDLNEFEALLKETLLKWKSQAVITKKEKAILASL
ncbi:MAG: hypothetical protein KJ597_07340, partial [Nanoarchaeota archaeon]|nr:hypothetical protein [Nanoarchaeota archaeon]